MALFHRHDWKTTKRVYNPPREPMLEIEGRGPIAADLIEKAMFGFTVYQQTCRKCGETRAFTNNGKWEAE